MRFNPLKETKEKDIEWFHKIFKRRVEMCVDNVLKEKENDSDKSELRARLEEGDSFFGDEAAEKGIVDAAITPDEYFSETLFKGKKYKIGKFKPSFV